MSSLVMTITETLRYRGAIGQWSWMLHRLTGLGVLFFLFLHVIDTSWAVFYPELYEHAIAIYQSPLFTIGEFALVFAVVYHAYNGLRIAIIDAKPQWWKYQQRAAIWVLGLTILTLLPTFILMFSHVVDHYNHDPFILPLDEVLLAQIPFAVGIAAAVVAAVIFSGLSGLITGSSNRSVSPGQASASNIERFWWSYMRISGLLILPLVFGHLALVHVIQGVFDLTTATTVVGTGGSEQAASFVLGNGFNETATAVEFVGERWNHLVASVAVWKIYDAGLLLLVTVHGFNGLRYVLTDYTMRSPLLRRAAVYFCIMGAVTLLILGVGALLGSINEETVNMAIEARARLMQ